MLDLTPLEERHHISFLQICELPSGGQLSIYDNIVNAPADVSSVQNGGALLILVFLASFERDLTTSRPGFRVGTPTTVNTM